MERRWKRWAAGLLALGGLLLLGAALWGRTAGVAMIVEPPSPDLEHVEPPPDVERRLSIRRAGATLVAWAWEPERPLGTVFLLHGIRDGKTTRIGTARRMVQLGFRVVAVDSRGHGESNGRYLTYGVEESKDLVAWADAVERELGPLGPLGVVGTSYGAATALQYAARDERVEAAVAIAPFASLRRVVFDYVDWMGGPLGSLTPDTWLHGVVDEAGETAGFDPDAASPVRAVRDIDRPILLIHSRDDERIPFGHARAIARAGNTVELRAIEGASHVATGRASGVPELVDRWLRLHLLASPEDVSAE